MWLPTFLQRGIHFFGERTEVLAFDNFVLFDRVHLPICLCESPSTRSRTVQSAALLRVIHPELVEMSLMRIHSSGLAGKGIVIPACTPIVPRVIVWVRLVVARMICAVAVGVSIVKIVALSEGADCENDCDQRECDFVFHSFLIYLVHQRAKNRIYRKTDRFLSPQERVFLSHPALPSWRPQFVPRIRQDTVRAPAGQD